MKRFRPLRVTRDDMNNIITMYLVGGFIISLIVAVWIGRKDPEAFNPIEIFLDPWGFILGFVLWPLWVCISLIEGFGFKLIEKSTFAKQKGVKKETPSIIPVGEMGVSRTPLKPSGKVRIDDQTVNAQTKGEFIPAGDRVVVDGHSMGNIIVKKLD
jgi:membrane-bound ClpP family serine protease